MSRKRPHSSSPDCPICYETFDLVDKLPLVGTCGHSICTSCCQKLSNCPICKKESAFDNKVKNFALIELIDDQSSGNEAPKLPQNSVDCSNCTKRTNEKDCFVCLECVSESRAYSTLEELIDLIDGQKMCTDCAQAVLLHGGHEAIHQLKKTKIGLRSMDLKMTVERYLEKEKKALRKMQSACEIAQHSYLQYFESCAAADGRMGGSELDLSSFKGKVRLSGHHLNADKLLCTRSVWEFTNKCLRATQFISMEKKKLQSREFESNEELRALMEKISAEDIDDGDIPYLHLSEWKQMTLKEKRAKVNEMMREACGSSDESEGEEETKENEDEEETEESDESEYEEETEESEG